MNAPLTADELLRLHPWPQPYAQHYAGHPRRDWVWRFDLPCTPAALWPAIADTSRMNRALGLAEMRFEERGGARWGRSRNGGREHEWVEVPWEWVAERWISAARIYTRGYLHALYAVFHLEPRGEGTRLHLLWSVVPNGLLGDLATRVGMRSLEAAYRRALPDIAARLSSSQPALDPAPPPALGQEARARLHAQREALLAQGLPPPCVEALTAWIREGDPMDLHRIQILERARAWSLPEEALLRTALHATRAGLLTLSWDTVCPHCRGVRDENPTLSGLRARARCDVCDLDFRTDTPESVEVTFRVHPSIRAVPEVTYCSAEPAKKEHVRVQRTLAPRAAETLRPCLAPGRYRLRAGRDEGFLVDVAPEGEESLRWRDQAGGAPVRVREGADLSLDNPTDAPRTFTLERARWSDLALRPGALLSRQDFRDLFSEEYLAADVHLGVGEQTLLFTDVVGSTALYASQGDPGAFVEIKRHFDEVSAVVRAHRGAVVKTIGDAIMAAFVSPLDGVGAAMAIQRAFHPDRHDTPIRLRLSLNTGACIAVRLNANVDYFGGTVNVAAKLQSLVEGHQVVVSDRTYRAPGVAERLADEGVAPEALTYESRALPEPVAAWRWTVPRSSRPVTDLGA